MKPRPTVTLIVAMDRNRGIGKDGQMPWHLPEDLKHFKRYTLGKPCIMGRKTFQSLLEFLGKPLPGRQNIILTRDEDFSHVGVDVAHSMDQAFDLASGESGVVHEVMVIGGGEIYRLALSHASRMLITQVDAACPADTHFPEFDQSAWQLLSSESHSQDDRHAHDFKIQVWRRRDWAK